MEKYLKETEIARPIKAEATMSRYPCNYMDGLVLADIGFVPDKTSLKIKHEMYPEDAEVKIVPHLASVIPHYTANKIPELPSVNFTYSRMLPIQYMKTEAKVIIYSKSMYSNITNYLGKDYCSLDDM